MPGPLLLHYLVRRVQVGMTGPSLTEGDYGLVVEIFRGTPRKYPSKNALVACKLLREELPDDFSREGADVHPVVFNMKEFQATFQEKLTSRQRPSEEGEDVRWIRSALSGLQELKDLPHQFRMGVCV